MYHKFLIMFEDFRLKIFVAVAQEGSFTKAAEKVGVSQPAVSQNIAELEKTLSVRLFDRQKNETVLTPEGQVFMQYAERILDESAMVRNMFSRLTPCTIRYSATEEVYQYLVCPVMESFSKVHPEIVFERMIFDDDVDLRFVFRPDEGTPFDIDDSVLCKVKLSVSGTQNKKGDFTAARENVSSFELVFMPSPAFSLTRTCRVLKEYLISFLTK